MSGAFMMLMRLLQNPLRLMRLIADLLADWRPRGTAGPALTLALSITLVAGCGITPTTTSIGRKNAPTPIQTIAVMGASDAWGIGTGDPDRLNWPALLATDLPQTPRLINLGEPGVTLEQARRSELPVVLGEHPDVVVIWLVVNDIIDNVTLNAYANELRQTLTAIRQQIPRAQIFVGNAPDLTQIPYFASRDQKSLYAQVNSWNSAIAQVCEASGATLVNIYSAWRRLSDHPDYISSDGLHPSYQGAEALARVFSLAIEQSANRIQ
jgi:lysophospholipase L1-like esterase